MKPRRIHEEQLIVAVRADAEDRVAGGLRAIRSDHEPLL
jgi:hypothetical protein